MFTATDFAHRKQQKLKNLYDYITAHRSYVGVQPLLCSGTYVALILTF